MRRFVSNETPSAPDDLRFQFQLHEGSNTATVRYRDHPTQTTRYELCIYDNRPGVRMAMGVAPGPGWRASGSPSSPTGYKYRDSAALQDGIKVIGTKASNLDKAKLKLTGKGAMLPDNPQLPLHYPVTAQLYASDGACWEAEFQQSAASKNGGFTAKTP